MQIPLLIATAAEDLGHSHSVWDALPHLGGMLMVLVTLAIMWGITASVAKIIAILHAKPSAPAPAPAAAVPTPVAPPAVPTPAAPPAVPTPAAPPAAHVDAVPVAVIAAAVAAVYESEQIVSSEVAAVIAAAVACMSGGSRRIISIKPADTSWEKAGRQSILYSHRIR